MSVITKDQLIKKIQHGNYKCARIYDRDYKQVPHNIPVFEQYEEASPDDLIVSLEAFYNNYSTWPGIFTILLRTSSTSNLSKAALVRINTATIPAGSTGQPNPIQGHPFKTAEEIYKEVLEKAKGQMQLEMYEAQIKMKDSQLEQFTTTSGRLTYMFENFLMAKMGKAAPMFQPGATLQGTVQVENTEEDEVSDKDFGEALVKIKDKFGIQTLMKIAERIDTKDPQIDVLINMLK